MSSAGRRIPAPKKKEFQYSEPQKDVKVKIKSTDSPPILNNSRQHLIDQYLQLVEDYKAELEEKKRLAEETDKVMHQIASISKQDEYLDELFLSIQKKKEAEKAQKKKNAETTPEPPKKLY